jgi:hypothetical protein
MNMDQSNEVMVAQFKDSGLTQEAFCKNNNIALERLRYHLYKNSRPKANPGNQSSHRQNNHSFISFPQPAPRSVLANNETSQYTIIHGTFTCQQLAELIRGLGGSAC